MRRPGLSGDVWPDDVQELLLRAALLPGSAAVEAWQRARPRIDVDELPGELHRLMPLLAASLTRAGVDDPDLARLKGVHQFTWYRSALLFEAVGPLLAELRRRQVPALLLRGAAVVARGGASAGVRQLNDVDVLLPPDAVGAAQATAGELGWRVVAAEAARADRRRATWLTDPRGRIVSLHWTPTPHLPFDAAATTRLWERAVAGVLASHAVRVLGPADHLVHSVADGARADSGSSLRWITDCAPLVSGGDVDWDVVVAEARRTRSARLLSEALRYLSSVAQVEVPTSVLGDLAGTPLRARDRAAHVLSVTTTPRIPAAAEAVGRYLRLSADLPPGRAVAGAPEYARALLATDRRRSVPTAAVRRVVRAAVAPVPSRAALSTPGAPRGRRAEP